MMSVRHSIHDGYIRSISGLRAVAVLCVLLFHVDLTWARGGYIGVDVFFVISGFVITRKLLREIPAGEFGFGQFILWRVGRLFPSLFIAVALTLFAAYFVLGPDELAQLGHTSLWTILAGSNIFFWLDSGYFDADAAFKPLLHTWSLAVEEQFYLVWPLLIWLALTRWGKPGGLVLVAILGVASLLAAIYVVQDHPVAVFFLTPFRVYQFAIGGALAFISLPRAGRFLSLVTVAAVLSILAIAALAVQGEQGYAFTTIAPAVAAGIAIWSAHSGAATRLLANRPMEWLGDRSYSIYLAHWPIVVLWKLATDYAFSPAEQWAAVLLSIAAGGLLYAVVENPFRPRKSQSTNFRGRVLGGVVAVGVAAMMTGAHYWALRGFPERVPENLRAIADTMPGEWKARTVAVRTGICNFSIGTFEVGDFDRAACSQPPGDRKSYLIIGDSFASDAYLVFQKAFPDIYFGQITVPGCQLRMAARFERDDPCKELFRLGLEELALTQGYDGVILASNWLDSDYYRIDDILTHFEGSGLQVILVGQHIRFAHRLPAIVTSSMSVADATRKARQLILKHQIQVNQTLKERFSGRSEFLDFIDLQCQPECAIFDQKGRIAYLDDSHISLAGADIIAHRLRNRADFIDRFDTSSR